MSSIVLGTGDTEMKKTHGSCPPWANLNLTSVFFLRKRESKYGKMLIIGESRSYIDINCTCLSTFLGV